MAHRNTNLVFTDQDIEDPEQVKNDSSNKRNTTSEISARHKKAKVLLENVKTYKQVEPNKSSEIMTNSYKKRNFQPIDDEIMTEQLDNAQDVEPDTDVDTDTNDSDKKSDSGSDTDADTDTDYKTDSSSNSSQDSDSDHSSDSSSDSDTNTNSDASLDSDSDPEADPSSKLDVSLESDCISNTSSVFSHKKPISKSISDTSTETESDSDSDSEKNSINISVDDQDQYRDYDYEKKLVHEIDKIFGDDVPVSLEYIINESWFKKLSKNDRREYLEKIKNLINKKNIPSTKEILDLNIPPRTIELLLFERLKLEDHDKMSPEYTMACEEFIRNFKFFSDKKNSELHDKLNSIQEKMFSQNKFTLSLKNRILNSDYDFSVKSVLFDKYLIMSDSDSDEAIKYKNWLETVLSIPTKSKEIKTTLNMSELSTDIMTKLNDKIFGMIEAKEEFLCTFINMISNPNCKYKALGLYGPPGIGKTMIVEILSQVLDLPFEKIALGGVSDANFLEGHGFTYIGSEPGCITKALIKMGCNNGIIYFDEVDKTSKYSKKSEIEHALLHITDFTQNHNFRDKYMPEIPIDLSKIIFIYSMNSVDHMDSALISRIPIIKFNGYDAKEKIIILKKFILPEILSNYLMKNEDVYVSDEVAEHLINSVKEADEIDKKSGVRELKNITNKLVNRINFHKIVSVNGKIPIKVSFEIANFSLPYTLTKKFIDTIISNTYSDKNTFNFMYI